MALAACLVVVLVAASSQATDYYVDATDGDDGHDGRSPETAWRSLDRVNAGGFGPGDRVLFQRGEIFRGQLRPTSGADGRPIVYGAYGVGDKPKLMGSVERNDPSHWASAGANLWVTAGPFPDRIGNVILDDNACGWRKFDRESLGAPGDFYFDGSDGSLVLWSTSNPAEVWSDIELAVNRHIIDDSGVGQVVFEGLHLLYGATHGIGGGNSHHVTVRGCDISFIGGGGWGTVRLGNGVEFWADAQEMLVEGNRLWQIYDAALTNQSTEPCSQTDIVYRNNVVWQAEYCFEAWVRPTTSTIRNIVFENNTCAFSGYGWGHEQRPDPHGWHLIFWGMEAPPESFLVRNNVFYEALVCAVEPWDRDWSWLTADGLDYNLYYQSTGAVACTSDGTFGPEAFADYQSTTGRDRHSLVADPLFVDAAEHDFRLLPGSPAIDRGVDNGLAVDLQGTPRPQGAAIDLGAYEYDPSVEPDAGAEDAGAEDVGPDDVDTEDAGAEDAGAEDAGADVQPDEPLPTDGGGEADADLGSADDGGCGCAVAGRGAPFVTPLGALVVLGATRRLRRRARTAA